MVRRVGIGLVRLEQALQRPVVHGRGDEPLRRRGVRAEPVGQRQLLGHGMHLVGGQVLAGQHPVVVFGLDVVRHVVAEEVVMVDVDDEAGAVAVRQHAVEHCESLHIVHSILDRYIYRYPRPSPVPKPTTLSRGRGPFLCLAFDGLLHAVGRGDEPVELDVRVDLVRRGHAAVSHDGGACHVVQSKPVQYGRGGVAG